MRVLDDEEIFPLTYEDIEISNFNMVKKILMSLEPEVVINTATYHKVEECEKMN